MSAPTPALDPVSVATAAVAALLGVGAAEYLGPYLVMLLGAFLGSLVALWLRDPTRRVNPFLFVLALMILSTMISVPIAEMVGAWAGKDWKWALFPVSAVLSGIGEYWIEVVKWAWSLIKPMFERKTVGGPQP